MLIISKALKYNNELLYNWEGTNSICLETNFLNNIKEIKNLIILKTVSYIITLYFTQIYWFTKMMPTYNYDKFFILHLIERNPKVRIYREYIYCSLQIITNPSVFFLIQGVLDFMEFFLPILSRSLEEENEVDILWNPIFYNPQLFKWIGPKISQK